MNTRVNERIEFLNELGVAIPNDLERIVKLEAENKALRETIARVEPLVEEWSGSKIMNVSGVDMQIHSSEDKENCANELKQALENECDY